MRLWRACLVLLLLVNTAGLALIYKKLDNLEKLFPFTLLQDSVQTQTQISTQLATIHTLLSKNTRSSSVSVLGMSELLPDKSTDISSSEGHYVSVTKDASQETKVYKEQAIYSTVLGRLVPDYKYPYFTKVGNWYLIGLSAGVTGWVEGGNVTTSP